ncbi:septum formation initiator family protein [Mycobacterium sp. 1274756.6]|uniref:FtsB family cell division protein n=1 Tax=Mycobacterium sp. 1274756.6 TaxID=1834076 RepID=UPI0007FC639D|nr:septum formation initiator family protein [Mycobacterium sp. 1274756.6]OBJ67929.1 septation inhibitor protein [Mycobacterium sp. 1274756.6]
MSEAKRRTPASRPARGGDKTRDRPRQRALPRRVRPEAGAKPPAAADPIRQGIAEAAEERAEQRMGFTAGRAAVLAVVVCVLTLTTGPPVRTYFAQRTEMHQLAASEAALRQKIADLQLQKEKLADPAYIAAQARERLGFVMPGDVPYQVQLPPTADVPAVPGGEPQAVNSGDPWYTALWHTIADAPHGPPPEAPAEPAGPPAPPLPPPAPPGPPGG